MSEPGPTPQQDRPFLPAMGRDGWLSVYDAMTWLGARTAHRRLVAAAGLAPGATVLEIGCGTGNLLRVAADAQPGATVVGLDPDPAALDRARGKIGQRRIRVEQGFADELPHADGSVDVVLSAFMFHHLPPDAKRAMLREVRRVLVPGGQLLLLDFEGHPRPLRILSPVMRLVHGRGSGHGHGHEGHGHEGGHGHDGAHGHGDAAEPLELAPNGPAMVQELLVEAGLSEVAQVDAAKSAFGPWISYRAVRAG